MGCSRRDVGTSQEGAVCGSGTHRAGARPGGTNLLGPVELGGCFGQCVAPLPAARKMPCRQSLAPHRSSLVLAKAWASRGAQSGAALAGDSVGSRGMEQRWPGEAVTGERAALGARPLSAPRPPHLPGGGEQPPSSQRKKESPAQARWAAPGNGACTCLCKRVSGFVAVWGPLCAAALTSRGLRVAACLHRQEPTSLETYSVRPVARVRSGPILHPAAVREAEPLSVGVSQPRRAEGPWQLRFQAAGRQRGFCKGDGKRNSIPPLVFSPPLC